MSIKRQAEVYRRGLLLGLFSATEVIAWCDSIISTEVSPDIAIIEASHAGSRGFHAVAQALSEVDGDYDEPTVVRILFSSMYDLVKQDLEQASKVARWLYRMANAGEVPADHAQAEMLCFYDAIDLAKDGILGHWQYEVNEMLKFLKKFATPSAKW